MRGRFLKSVHCMHWTGATTEMVVVVVVVCVGPHHQCLSDHHLHPSWTRPLSAVAQSHRLCNYEGTNKKGVLDEIITHFCSTSNHTHTHTHTHTPLNVSCHTSICCSVVCMGKQYSSQQLLTLYFPNAWRGIPLMIWHCLDYQPARTNLSTSAWPVWPVVHYKGPKSCRFMMGTKS